MATQHTTNGRVFHVEPVPPEIRDPNPAWTRWDKSHDPASYLDDAPPNLGRALITHVKTFQSFTTSTARVYRPSDEAMKDSWANARHMRNDASVMECVEMRQRACALLDWHIEPEDEKSTDQKALVEVIKKMIEDVSPNFMQYREVLLNATWFGKYGIMQKWRRRKVAGEMRNVVQDWLPLHGDKIVFRHEDDTLWHQPQQPGIRIGFGAGERDRPLSNKEWEKIEPTDYGLAYFLDSWERPMLAFHRHQIEDGEYEEPSNAGRIHGKGVRSVIYWIWYQKQDLLHQLVEYLERSAAGYDLWYYPMHNPEAEAATRKAAEEHATGGGSRNVVTVPLPQGDDAMTYRVDHIEPGMAGIEQLHRLLTEYFGHQIKRYILGQTLTSEASATGLGSGLAEVHLDTFMQIIRYDAALLEDTITKELLHPLILYNFPEYAHTKFQFRIATEVPDNESRLKAVQVAFEMGLPIEAQYVRDLIGAAKPEGDAEVLDKMAMLKAQLDLQGQMQASLGGGTNEFGQNGNGQPQMNQAAGQVRGIETAAVSNAEYDADGPDGSDSERSKIIESDGPRGNL